MCPEGLSQAPMCVWQTVKRLLSTCDGLFLSSDGTVPILALAMVTANTVCFINHPSSLSSMWSFEYHRAVNVNKHRPYLNNVTKQRLIAQNKLEVKQFDLNSHLGLRLRGDRDWVWGLLCVLERKVLKSVLWRALRGTEQKMLNMMVLFSTV